MARSLGAESTHISQHPAMFTRHSSYDSGIEISEIVTLPHVGHVIKGLCGLKDGSLS